MGIHNEWVVVLESAWPEIGWQLFSLKDNVSAAVDGVRKAMAPLGDYNRTLAAHFFEKDLITSTAHEIRGCRLRRADLVDSMQEEMKQTDAQLDNCREAGRLLEEVGLSDGGVIEAETIRRYTAYAHRCQRLMSLHWEINEFERLLKAREAYVSQSQLLHYLHSKRGRVQPRKLAKALAGLPMMNWRQSRERCRSFQGTAQIQFNYHIFAIMLSLRRKLGVSIHDSSWREIEQAFRKLGNQSHVSMRFFREHWRDFRLVIEELSKHDKISDGQLPYVLATNFLARVKLPKSRSEQFLSKSEALKLQ
jgi:hypothetical protein